MKTTDVANNILETATLSSSIGVSVSSIGEATNDIRKTSSTGAAAATVPSNAADFKSSSTETLAGAGGSSVVSMSRPQIQQHTNNKKNLDARRCLYALASLRHTKYFQAKIANFYPCLILIRIMRDLTQRVPTWTPLSGWVLELLVERIIGLASEGMKLSPGDGLRKIFECLSGGILLSSSAGLRDPCERETTDTLRVLGLQDREDITASAQHALRLIAFRKIHKVLDLDDGFLEQLEQKKNSVPDGGDGASVSNEDTNKNSSGQSGRGAALAGNNVNVGESSNLSGTQSLKLESESNKPLEAPKYDDASSMRSENNNEKMAIESARKIEKDQQHDQ